MAIRLNQPGVTLNDWRYTLNGDTVAQPDLIGLELAPAAMGDGLAALTPGGEPMGDGLAALAPTAAAMGAGLATLEPGAPPMGDGLATMTDGRLM